MAGQEYARRINLIITDNCAGNVEHILLARAGIIAEAAPAVHGSQDVAAAFSFALDYLGINQSAEIVSLIAERSMQYYNQRLRARAVVALRHVDSIGHQHTVRGLISAF